MKLLAFIDRLYVRYYLYWAWRVGCQRAFILALFCAASVCNAANTNQVAKAEKERKTEHQDNKVIVKEREKGSNAEWKTVKEYTLMFKNNRKAKKPKAK